MVTEEQPRTDSAGRPAGESLGATTSGTAGGGGEVVLSEKEPWEIGRDAQPLLALPAPVEVRETGRGKGRQEQVTVAGGHMPAGAVQLYHAAFFKNQMEMK